MKKRIGITILHLLLASCLIFTLRCGSESVSSFVPGDGGTPPPGGNPGDDCEGDECNVTATVGDGTITIKALVQQGNGASGYRLYSGIAIPSSLYAVYDDANNPLQANNIAGQVGDSVHFNFTFPASWDVQCVASFEVQANNLESLSFDQILGAGANDLIIWSAKLAKSGNATLSYTNANCTAGGTQPLTASLGAGTVSMKACAQQGATCSSYIIYNNIPLACTDANTNCNYIATDANGNHLTETAIVAQPGSTVNFYFSFPQTWHVQCIKSFQIATTNLEGLTFQNLTPVGTSTAINWRTTANQTGSQSLSYTNNTCN